MSKPTRPNDGEAIAMDEERALRMFTKPPLRIRDAADRYDHRVGNDDYAQAGDLYRLIGAGDVLDQLGPLLHAQARRVPRDPTPADRSLPEGRQGVRDGSGQRVRHSRKHPPGPGGCVMARAI
jgi:hypothetical protein